MHTSFHMPVHFLLLLLRLCSSQSKTIGLFMNTGPYSHDAMMQHIADDLYDKRYKVFLLQIRVFNFNMTLPKSKYVHPTLRYDYSGPETLAVMQEAQAQIWHGPVPLGGGTVNLKGVYAFQKLYEVQSAACQAALKSESYLSKIKAAHLDFIVIDYVLNECALGISAILKIPRVYLSNYPLIEVYSNTFGVPSNPSYVPAVLSPTSSRMTFVQRLQNVLIHTATIFIRASLIWRSQKLLHSVGHDAELRGEERKAIFYGTPLEFLLDGPRPLSNSVKYLGCLRCSRGDEIRTSQSQSWLPDKNMIIASFGTCASATRLPKQVLNSFITAFSQLKQYKVLLQMPGIEIHNSTWPSNVVAVQWIPLLDLLRSPSVKLLISHGGMSTTVEAVNNAVPMLGIPLQGDQMYNVGRLVEKGVADVLPISGLTAELLSKKLRRMLPITANDQTLNLKQKRAIKNYRGVVNYEEDLECESLEVFLRFKNEPFQKQDNRHPDLVLLPEYRQALSTFIAKIPKILVQQMTPGLIKCPAGLPQNSRVKRTLNGLNLWACLALLWMCVRLDIFFQNKAVSSQLKRCSGRDPFSSVTFLNCSGNVDRANTSTIAASPVLFKFFLLEYVLGQHVTQAVDKRFNSRVNMERRKIVLLKKMLSTYQTFERQKMKKNMTTAPAFWIDWAARHFSNQEKREAFLVLKYTDQFFSYFSFDVLFVSQLIFIIMFLLAV
ncbi:hypothetical protein M513_10546 [Trichuris suis]|uniref:glucuronosyltransferase n=1 Tax=Trichuris suis TaxID=68888 RepID=A0A085LUG6_9BILA|nr:hypothetical protein M513_10546 [Trichuris suis]